MRKMIFRKENKITAVFLGIVLSCALVLLPFDGAFATEPEDAVPEPSAEENAEEAGEEETSGGEEDSAEEDADGEDDDAPWEIVSEGYIVVDVDTGDVILEKNSHKQYYPASTTKVMTALVAIENIEDFDDTLTFSEWAINSLSWDSSTLYPEAKIGEEMNVLDALYGMLLSSANECANALAEYVGGSEEAFVAMMNDKAAELGAYDTHFANAHGLHDEEHYTTPYDLMLIFSAALENDLFKQIDSTASYSIPDTNLTAERKLTMGHRMISGDYDYEYAVAGKTGNTQEAGRTLVTYAEKEDMRLISVIMKSTDEAFYRDTETLLEEAFSILEEEKEVIVDDSPEGLITSEVPEEEETLKEEETEEDEPLAEAVSEVEDESEETSALFWILLIVACISGIAAVILVILLIVQFVSSRRKKKEPEEEEE